jgi:hypothetical protein
MRNENAGLIYFGKKPEGMRQLGRSMCRWDDDDNNNNNKLRNITLVQIFCNLVL